MKRSVAGGGKARTARAWALAALLGASGSPHLVHAQEVPMASEQTLGNISYLNGGVGDEEVTYIKGLLRDYSLRLAFSRAGTPRPEYVASVAVTITDARGRNVFELASVGPYLLLKLPAGSYTVTATYENQTVTRPVTAGKGTSLTNIVWK